MDRRWSYLAHLKCFNFSYIYVCITTRRNTSFKINSTLNVACSIFIVFIVPGGYTESCTYIGTCYCVLFAFSIYVQYIFFIPISSPYSVLILSANNVSHVPWYFSSLLSTLRHKPVIRLNASSSNCLAFSSPDPTFR